MKLAFLTNISFSFNENFKDLTSEKIENSIFDKVTFIEFNGTFDLFFQINKLIGNGMYEVRNCLYDSKYVIQSIYLNVDNDTTNGYDKLIFVKRKIHDDDTYTFLEYDTRKLENLTDIDNIDKHIYDKYNYESITMSDIVNIIKNKYIINAVFVKDNDETHDIEFINTSYQDDKKYIGELTVRFNDNIETIKFFNLLNLMIELTEKSKDKNVEHEEILKKMEEKMGEHKVNYIYTNKNIEFGVLNCYYEMSGVTKNKIMSSIIEDDIYGNVIVSFENTLNEDTRILNISKELFKNISDKLKNKNTLVPKNKNFFNIYYEFN